MVDGHVMLAVGLAGGARSKAFRVILEGRVLFAVGLAGSAPREALRAVILEGHSGGRVLLAGSLAGGAPFEALRAVMLEGHVLLAGGVSGKKSPVEDATGTPMPKTFMCSTRYGLPIAILSN